MLIGFYLSFNIPRVNIHKLNSTWESLISDKRDPSPLAYPSRCRFSSEPLDVSHICRVSGFIEPILSVMSWWSKKCQISSMSRKVNVNIYIYFVKFIIFDSFTFCKIFLSRAIFLDMQNSSLYCETNLA